MIYTNKFGIPQAVVDAISKNTYDLTKVDQNIISVTTLNNPPRIRQLSIRYWDKITEDASDNIWRLLGSCVHEVLSRIEGSHRLIEERIYYDIKDDKIITIHPNDEFRPEENHVYVSGKPDLYDEKTESVDDYKVTSAYSLKYDKQDWVNQLNLYAFLYIKLGFKVKNLNINAILRDWNRNALLKDKTKEYPEIPFKHIQIPLWSLSQQEKYLKDRVKLHRIVRKLDDDELPLCTEKERWQKKDKKGNITDIRCCFYCPANLFCDYYIKNYVK
jgi:hypothetical protein